LINISFLFDQIRLETGLLSYKLKGKGDQMSNWSSTAFCLFCRDCGYLQFRGKKTSTVNRWRFFK